MSLLKRNSTLVACIVIFLVCLPALLPLFQKGFFLTDDGEWMIIRFTAFHEALRDGQFPVRFLSRLNFQYGYPVANFLYPGFMYMGEFFRFLGFGFVDTIKILYGLSIVSGSFFVFFWLRKFFTPFASLTGSIVYAYIPYHLYDLYTRGSVGELLALAVVPYILWQLERKSIFWTALGIGLLVLFHNTLAILFFALIVLSMVLTVMTKQKKKQRAITYVLMCLFGVGLAAFFWIPALYDLQFTEFSRITVSEWQKYFANVHLIGIFVLGVCVLIFGMFVLRKADFAKHRLTVLFLILTLLSLFFASSLSAFFWSFLPASFIQFPFRFLSIAVITTPFLAAFSLSAFQAKKQYIGGILLIGIVFVSAIPYLSPKEIFDKGDAYYATNLDTTTVRKEYLSSWFVIDPTTPPDVIVRVENSDLTYVTASSKEIAFSVNTRQKSDGWVNRMYFPGWSATIDGIEVPIQYEEDGLIHFQVPEGRHSVRVFFTETPMRLFADGISITSFIGLLSFVIYTKRKRYEKV